MATPLENSRSEPEPKNAVCAITMASRKTTTAPPAIGGADDEGQEHQDQVVVADQLSQSEQELRIGRPGCRLAGGAGTRGIPRGDSL